MELLLAVLADWHLHGLAPVRSLTGDWMSLASRSGLDDCSLVNPFLIDTLKHTITLRHQAFHRHQHWVALNDWVHACLFDLLNFKVWWVTRHKILVLSNLPGGLLMRSQTWWLWGHLITDDAHGSAWLLLSRAASTWGVLPLHRLMWRKHWVLGWLLLLMEGLVNDLLLNKSLTYLLLRSVRLVHWLLLLVVVWHVLLWLIMDWGRLL